MSSAPDGWSRLAGLPPIEAFPIELQPALRAIDAAAVALSDRDDARRLREALDEWMWMWGVVGCLARPAATSEEARAARARAIQDARNELRAVASTAIPLRMVQWDGLRDMDCYRLAARTWDILIEEVFLGRRAPLAAREVREGLRDKPGGDLPTEAWVDLAGRQAKHMEQFRRRREGRAYRDAAAAYEFAQALKALLLWCFDYGVRIEPRRAAGYVHHLYDRYAESLAELNGPRLPAASEMSETEARAALDDLQRWLVTRGAQPAGAPPTVAASNPPPRGEDPPSASAAAERLHVDVAKKIALLRGKKYALESEEQAHYLRILVQAGGGWVSGAAMKTDRTFPISRADRVRKALPREIQRLTRVKRGGGGGYRLAL